MEAFEQFLKMEKENFNFSGICFLHNYLGMFSTCFCLWICLYGDSANAVPTIRNCTPEFPTFGGIAGCQPDRSAMDGPLPGRTA